MEAAHTYSVSEVLKHLNVSETKGLSAEQVEKLQEIHGPNGNVKLAFSVTFCVFDCCVIVNTPIYAISTSKLKSC